MTEPLFNAGVSTGWMTDNDYKDRVEKAEEHAEQLRQMMLKDRESATKKLKRVQKRATEMALKLKEHGLEI